MPPGKLCTGRPLHQTTLCLGDQPPCYSTTHTQHHRLDLRKGSGDVSSFSSTHSRDVSSLSSTHSRDVHSPKVVTPNYVLRALRTRNRTRNWEGLAMKEVTNPPEEMAYRSAYASDHCAAKTSDRGDPTSGRPTHWHRHDILTGEKKAPGVPGDPRRKRLESEICSARRWDRDCTSLRLY